MASENPRQADQEEVTAWDARAEFALGVFIRRHLAEDPPPPDSVFAAELERWADRLRAHGQSHLQELGAPPFRPV